MKQLLILLLLISNYAYSDSVYLLGNSYHLPSAGATNSNHQFIAIEHRDYVAGTFINSYGYRTSTVGYRYNITDQLIPNVSTNLLVGATYGYRQCFGGRMHDDAVVCPSAVVEFRYTKYKVQPTLFFIGGGAVLLFNVKF